MVVKIAQGVAPSDVQWRKLLWLNHARYTPFVRTPYGVDGEMQCCGIDFKRWAAEEIDEHLKRRALAPALVATVETAQADWCDICQAPQYVTPDGEHHCGEKRG